MEISEEHSNWLTVGELICSIRKPISIYVDDIVRAFHKTLCKDLLHVGKCTSPEDCSKSTKDSNLCKSCKCWLKKLEASHEKGKNPSWHKNCKSARWSEDHWEVAKYFMPPPGSNLNTVKDANSTDLPSLLNVLEWMKDAAFLGKTRANVDLVRKLRSQVRNTWAHAPQQVLTDDEKSEGFSIATDTLKDLENVCPNTENVKCLEHLEYLKTNGVTNVVESELKNLWLQRHLLDDIKEELTNVKVERLSDENMIDDHQQQLVNLERALSECSQKMDDIKNFNENIYKQFDNFAEVLKLFLRIPSDIHEIRDSIGQIRDAKINEQKAPKPTSCLPDKLINFTGRQAEIQKVIALLKDEKKAVVSLKGGPGFGKTAIAIQVSHKLSEDLEIPVFFSHLANATTVTEMIRQLCLDVGVNSEVDPEERLIFWLRNIKRKVIFVMDDIDNLLEDKSKFYEFVRSLRKNSNQQCQIVTTSRMSFEIPELQTCEVQVDEMDSKECMELLKKKCPQKDDIFLQKLAELCGKSPLAVCIAGSQVDNFEDSDELLKYLEQKPMMSLEDPKSDQYVDRTINMSFKKCSDEEQKTLARLSVFEGSFGLAPATVVIEKDKLDTSRTLMKLVSRSLIIKQPTQHRYSIHLLIKHFLKDKQKCGNEQISIKAKQARAEAMRAEVLMVEYYLELGHQLTMKSYSKDGYKDNREALKREASNIQNVLKICCQQEDPTSSHIPDCLARSKVYTNSARFFLICVSTIIPGPIIDEFLQRCAKMAEERKQVAVKVTFDCLLADRERNKTIGKYGKHQSISKMEEIKKEFETHYEDLKEDKSLCSHYYYHYGRYLLGKSERLKGRKKLNLQIHARDQLKKSLKLREKLTGTSAGRADKIFSLLQLGNSCKNISTTQHSLKDPSAAKTTKQAEEYYKEAIQLSQDSLGDHNLTLTCHKSLGNLFKAIENHKLAEKEYTTAKQMRENLGLDASDRYVGLLSSLGICLGETNRPNEAIKVLERARDTAENLAKSGKHQKYNKLLAKIRKLVSSYTKGIQINPKNIL